jgi:hypothetical protein
MKDNMIKKLSLIVLFITSLLFSLQASAGFREALSALQHKDAELMLTEVEKAVEAKNYDGASLFIHTINYQYHLNTFLPVKLKSKIDEQAKTSNQLPTLTFQEAWSIFLSESQQKKLLFNLQQVPKTQDYLLKLFSEKLLIALGGEPKDIGSDLNNYYPNLTLDYELALVKLGITNFESIGYYETENIKKLRKTIKVDEIAGFKLFTQLILESYKQRPADWNDSTCIIGDAYFYGKFNMPIDYQEAYLWYHLTYTHFSPKCATDKLLTLYQDGKLKKFNPSLVKQMDALGGKLPLSENIVTANLPKIVISYRNKSPKLPSIVFSNSFPNYQISIFDNGRVEYKANYPENIIPVLINTNGYWPNYREQLLANEIIGEYSWNIKPSVVKALKNDLHKVGFLNFPNFQYSGMICDTGEHKVESVFILRNKIAEKAVNYQFYWGHQQKRDVPPKDETAVLFSIIEKHVPTKNIRCGEESLNKAHLDCVDVDRKIDEKAQAWLKLNHVKI